MCRIHSAGLILRVFLGPRRNGNQKVRNRVQLPYVKSMLFLLCVNSFTLGCAGPSTTSQSGNGSASVFSQVDTLTLLPIVSDTTLEEESREKILSEVHERVKLDLALKGYVLEKADSFSDTATIAPETVAQMSVKEMAQLGPADSHYLVLCVLKDFESSHIGVASSAEAKISALIIDKRQQRVIWKNEDTSSLTNSILNVGAVVMLVIDEESEAVARSIGNLFSTIPEKPMN